MINYKSIQSISKFLSVDEMSIKIGEQMGEYNFLHLECLSDRCPASFFDENFQTYPMYYGKHYQTNEDIFEDPYGIFDILGENKCPEILQKTVRPILFKLMEAFSIFLGKEQNYLLDTATRNNFQLYGYAREKKFINHIVNELKEGEISFESHKDISLFTLSFIPEIEILTPKMGWIKFRDQPNTYNVLIGSQMEELTNNKIQSSIHRVRKFDSSNVLFFGRLEVKGKPRNKIAS